MDRETEQYKNLETLMEKETVSDETGSFSPLFSRKQSSDRKIKLSLLAVICWFINLFNESLLPGVILLRKFTVKPKNPLPECIIGDATFSIIQNILMIHLES